MINILYIELFLKYIIINMLKYSHNVIQSFL